MEYTVSAWEPGLAGQSADGSERAASKRALLQALEERIAEIERRPINLGAGQAVETLPENAGSLWRFGVEEIDAALPQGRLDPHGLHDITAETARLWPSAIGFGLALLGRLSLPDNKAILWCQSRRMVQEAGRLYGHGLAAFGIDPARLLLVSAAREKDALWAVEEGLRTEGLAAVIGEVDGGDFTATRRLALACLEYRMPALLLRPPAKAAAGSAAATRWCIAAHPGATDPLDARMPLHPRWRIELLKCRGGRPGAWTVEWSYATHRFSLAAGLADRTAQSCPAPSGIAPRAQAG
jgi:protein ImuA